MKKPVLFIVSVLLVVIAVITINNFKPTTQNVVKIERKVINPTKKGKKKTVEERALYNEARNLYEFYRQVNPNTGKISKTEKTLELNNSKNSLLSKNNTSAKVPATSYATRGPSNLGGRTRSLVVDRSDNTGNTIIAGGVSGGVFRTTNGGASWTKVSANDEIHNVTAIVQDPRTGSEDTWYYATGEGFGNSASNSGAFYLGQGIWQSSDGGLNWTQMSTTSTGSQESFDNPFDVIFSLAVHPTTGDLYAAVIGQILRFNGTSWTEELSDTPSSTNQATDVVITSGGRVYVAFSGVHSPPIRGVWTSSTGNKTTGAWSRINASDFTPAGRVVLALAPSNEDKLYVLFDNANTGDCSNDTQEADLWRWDQGTTTFTDYTSVLPSEGCDMDASPSDSGNNPFSIQGGYDMIVSVKPDDEDFVVIGGTNVYKKADITDNSSRFIRIGGYASNTNYSLYSNHHPDIHALVFSPFSNTTLFTGTDGGVHRTDDINAVTVAWTSLNNDYQTFQFYHVAIDQTSGRDFVIGGAQDNGTTVGGTYIGNSNTTSHLSTLGGDGVAVGIPNYSGCGGASFLGGTQNGTLYRYCGTTLPSPYVEITPRISTGPDVLYPSKFITYFYNDPDNTNAIYYASEDKLLRTIDGANVTQDTWTDMGDVSTGEFIQTFSTTRGTYSAVSSYLLIGGDQGHIYRLDDPQNATNISSAVDITPSVPPNDATTGFPSIVTGLAIHPTNNDIVLATYSNYGTNSIFLSTNATNATPTWTLVERNLSAHSIRSAAITEVAGQTLYFVGTARGLYSTEDPTTTNWTREAPTEIGYALVSSLSYRPSDNHLLIGTHGNGMYETIITDVLSVDDVNNISSEITLFPNPVAKDINLKHPFGYGNNFKYNIVNLSGQTVMHGILSENKVDASSLRSGIYFIQLDIDGKTGTKKFIKK